MDREAIISDGVMLFGRRFWASVLGVLSTYITAGLLGPAGVGLLALFRMIPSLASLVNFGWVDATCRELLPMLTMGRTRDARHLRDVAYTAELGLASLWVVAALVYSLCASNPTVRLGVFIAGISMAITLFFRFMITDMVIDKDFKIQAKVGFLTSLLNFVLGIAAAWLWGPLGLFAAVTLVQLIEVLIFWRYRGFSLTFRWDRSKLYVLTRIGVPLAALTFFGSNAGVILWIERSILGVQGGLELLGLFVFSVAIVYQMDGFIGELLASYQSHLWATLAEPHDTPSLFQLIHKPSIVLGYVTAGLSVLVITIIPPCILFFLGKYRPTIDVLWLFVLGGMVGTLSRIPAILLKSAFANKQTYFMLSRITCTAFYAALLWLLVAVLKLGLVGAATAVLGLQIFIGIFTVAKAYPFYLKGWRAVCHFILEQITPMIVVIAIYLACTWLISSGSPVGSKSAMVNMLAVSACTLLFSGVFLVIGGQRKTGILSHFLKSLKRRHSVASV